MSDILVGLDVGMSNIRVAISEGSPELAYYEKRPYERVWPEEMNRAFCRAIDECGYSRESIRAMGIAVPAVVDRVAGTVLYGADFDFMSDHSLTSGLSAHCAVPVIADVDTVMAAWGEAWASPIWISAE